MPKTLPSRPKLVAPTPVHIQAPTNKLSKSQLAAIRVNPSALMESVEDAKDSAGIFLDELSHVAAEANTPYWRGYQHAVEVYRGLLTDLLSANEHITLRDTIELRDMLTRYLEENVYLDSGGATQCYEHGLHDSLVVCEKRLEETIESIADAA